ncbi:hypothetical protein E1091_05395, partial [Micromonospora fluostatini]
LIRIRTYPVGSTTITTSTSTGISTGSLGGMTQVTLLAAGVVGQFAFDTRFPVGVITGVLGAPYLIYLLVRTNRAGGSL